MPTEKDIRKFDGPKTPFYYYDTDMLNRTLESVTSESAKYGFHVHFAVKANFNRRIMETIAGHGLGADCVSGNEIKLALETGFKPADIVSPGVGKSDTEIGYALDSRIFCFNCESVAELQVINELAVAGGSVASVALRINPNVDANTHSYITTGIEDSKFGIRMEDLERAVSFASESNGLKLRGMHFHVGSQILNLNVFRNLCVRINEMLNWFDSRGNFIDVINVGGGLGIDHSNPDALPPFAEYFRIFGTMLERKPHHKIFFELGRAITGQSGSLITRVLYIKEGENTSFAIVDAGMTDLIRPSLYQAYHKIENITSAVGEVRYTVAGPVCESADVFARNIPLPVTRRGDLLAIRSAGAYGEVMASRYNMRDLPGSIFSDEAI